MHNNSDSTNTTGADGGARRSRRGRSRHHRPIIREDLGKWIWIDEPGEPHNSHLYVRKLFELADRPSKAILKTSADARYKLYVNGRYVGKGPVRSCAGVTYYDTYDIAELLTKGKNVIAFHAHHIGDSTNYAPLKRAGLICRTEITVRDEVITLETDETWRVHKADDWTGQGARMSDSLGYQEVYDAAARLDGWNEVKFKEKGWQDAFVVGNVPSMPWGDLAEREIPPLAEEKVYPNAILGLFNSPEMGKDTPASDVPGIMAASALADLKSGSINNSAALLCAEGTAQVKTPRGDVGVTMVLDFGREVFGNVEIGISGSGSGVIDLGYCEYLEDDRVKPDRAGVKYTDRVILYKGRMEWQGFEPRAFRYMRVDFRRCSKAVALDYVRVNETLYPVRHTGSFECSDSLVNDIWRMGAQTTRLCMEDTYIDSPWRDRAQWWGDARVQSRTAYYAFDDTYLLAQGLRQIASQQADDGSILGMYPGGGDKLVPDYALYWVFSLLDYYAFADDAGLLRDVYPNLERLLVWFGRHVDSDGLLCDVPGWPFIDLAEIDTRGESTALNSLFYHALRVAAVISAVIGREDRAEEYQQAAARLRLAINKFLYSAKRGLYVDSRVDGVIGEKFSRQANILAALFDVSDHYRKAGILRVLTGASLPEIETPYFASHLIEVLCAGDRHVDALHVIRKRWGDMVKAGATTFWEFFNGEGSRCHGWSASPVRDLIAEFVGIKPVIGSHRFSISPHVADLKWAKATINTKVGLLTVDWKIIRGALVISVDVPQGIKVDVYPPCSPNASITVDGKSHISQFVTLSGGSHTVRVNAERPPKQAPYDKSLEPAPMLHVEILGEAMQRGRRRLSLTTSPRGRTRTRRGEEPLVETGIVEHDTLEMPVEFVPEAQPEIATEEAAVATGKSRRGRSRRGGRGRSRGAEVVEQVPSEVTETPEIEQPAAEPVHAEETAEQAGKPRRRRSRHGRGRGAAEAEVSVVEVQPEPQLEAEPAPPPTEEQPTSEEPHRSRRRRSRRGGRGRHGAETVEQQPQEGVMEPEPRPAEVTAEPAEHAESGEVPAKPRRRRSRGGRRHRGNRSEQETTEQTPIAEPTPAIEPVVEATHASESTEPVQRPARRRRGPRRPKTETSESAPVEVTVEPPIARPIEIAPVPAISEEQPKNRRPRRISRKPAGEAPPEAPVVETPPPAPDPAPTAEPKKRRTYTRRPGKTAEPEQPGE